MINHKISNQFQNVKIHQNKKCLENKDLLIIYIYRAWDFIEIKHLPKSL